MPYSYDEGVTPVPARRCTRCSAPLAPAPDDGAGAIVGWFEPSALDPGTWLFTSAAPPPGAAGERWTCTACSRTFLFFPGGRTLRHP